MILNFDETILDQIEVIGCELCVSFKVVYIIIKYFGITPHSDFIILSDESHFPTLSLGFSFYFFTMSTNHLSERSLLHLEEDLFEFILDIFTNGELTQHFKKLKKIIFIGGKKC